MSPGHNLTGVLTAVVVSAALASWAGCHRGGDGSADRPREIFYLPPTGPADPDIKHVILISIDTLRADHLGCYGHPFVKTPNIDRLAAEGLLFENHISTAPTTLNSHTSLMTGTYGHTHGVPRNQFVVSDENAMLAEVLRENGFSTAAFIGAFPLHSVFNFDQGFDHFDERFEVLQSQAQVDQDQRIAGRVTDSVIGWLEGNASERMFLFVHYFDPHWPYAPPPPYDTMYRRDKQPFAGSLMDIQTVRNGLAKDRNGMKWQRAALDALYGGEITYTDAEVGRLFDALRKRGIYDESLIVLTADHGEAMNEHWEIWNHGNSTYQTTIRTPLIIRQPGGKLGGRRVARLAGNIDVMPTILDRLGIGHPERVEGISLAPLLEGADPPPRGPVFAEATKPWDSPWEDDPVWANALKCRAVHTGRWKYIYRPIERIRELYDLQTDPGERNNLLGSGDEEADQRAEHLSRLLEAWDDAARPLESAKDESEDTRLRLKALGYAGG